MSNAPFSFPGAHRMAQARPRLGEVTESDRNRLLGILGTARTNYANAKAWAADQADLSASLGVNRTRFQTFMDEAESLDGEMFTVETTLQSVDASDWVVSEEQVADIQTYAADVVEIARLINLGQVQARPPGPTPAPAPAPAGGGGGFPDLTPLLTAAAAAAAAFLPGAKKPGTQPVPKPVPRPVPASSGMPWWGWGLIGVGGLVGLATVVKVVRG